MQMRIGRTLFGVAVLALLCASSADVYAFGENLNTSVGKPVSLGPVRSPCEGGDVPSMGKLRSWMQTAPKLGSLKYGPKYKAKSRSCGGKILWKRRLYYVPGKAGQDLVSIRFPDAGLVSWRISVK